MRPFVFKRPRVPTSPATREPRALSETARAGRYTRGVTGLGRAALAGLALSNLVFLRAWMLAGGSEYFSSNLPSATMYSGLVAAWLLLGAILALVVKGADRGPWPMRLAATVLFLILLIPVDWLLTTAAGLTLPVMLARWGKTLVLGIPLMAFAAVVIVPLLQRFVVRVVPLVTAPMIVATVFHAFSPLLAKPVEAPVESVADSEQTSGVKVVWLVFDEMDALLASESRSDAPPLPAFSRLMSESFVGADVHSPSLETLRAIPAIFTGRQVVKATPNGHDLVLRFEDGSSGAWSRQESPFRRVRRAGLSTGVVGWLHPYCDTLPGQFDQCTWRPVLVPPASIPAAMRDHVQEVIRECSWPLRLLVTPWLLTPSQAEAQRHFHAETFRAIDTAAQDMMLDGGPGLYLAHYPVPHAPGVLDLLEPGTDQKWPDIYANAILADRVLSTLRANLEAVDEWSSTVVVVTSDHPWRQGEPFDARVPLVIKLAGEPSPFQYGARLSTLLLHDLLPRLATGEIATSSALARYMDDWRTHTSFD